MTVMLENNVLPIVNENDTVSVTELMFTDNDELSGLIAQMMHADTLILLSNIDGIFNAHPDDPAAELPPELDKFPKLKHSLETARAAASGDAAAQSAWKKLREHAEAECARIAAEAEALRLENERINKG